MKLQILVSVVAVGLFGCPGNDDPNPNPNPPGVCIRTGCSGQVCSDQDVVTTCEYRPEYACYDSAVCERQNDGKCGWTQTPELQQCLSQGGPQS